MGMKDLGNYNRFLEGCAPCIFILNSLIFYIDFGSLVLEKKACEVLLRCVTCYSWLFASVWCGAKEFINKMQCCYYQWHLNFMGVLCELGMEFVFLMVCKCVNRNWDF